MTRPVQTIWDRLEAQDCRPRGPIENFTALCPAHDDRKASLSVREGDDGRALAYCFAGCTAEAVIAALGLEWGDLFEQDPEPPTGPAKRSRRPDPAEPLPDEVTRRRWQQALRSNPKLLARIADRKGWSSGTLEQHGWGWDAKEKRIVIPVYNAAGELVNVVRYLPGGSPKYLALKGRPRDLSPAPESIEGNRIILTEGEGDALSLHALGLPAVGVPGANGWRKEHAKRFVGKRVVVLMDCDAAGRRLAQRVADSLVGVAAEVRVADLDPARDDKHDVGDEIAEAMREGPAAVEALRARLKTIVEPPPPLPTSTVLELVKHFISRFVVLPDDDALNALALWVLHSHAIDASDTTPYVAITSPEKGCGKTQLLEVLELVTARAWRLSGPPTEAVLFRKIEQDHPTVLIDETDRLFKVASERAEPLTAVLNGGNRRGSTVPRCVGEGTKMTVKDFDTFGAKALAGIDHTRWPDTIRDRCIVIRLHRKAPGEIVERFRIRSVQPDATEIGSQIARWAQEATAALREIVPPDLEALSPRAAAGWEPLLAVAIHAGADWPALAQKAALALFGAQDGDEATLGTRVLADIRTAFGGQDRLTSAALLSALNDVDDAPWPGWNKGAGLSPRSLSVLLTPYGIKSRSVRLPDGSTPKGFLIDQFTDAWSRYLPGSSSHPPHRHNPDKHGGNVAKPSATDTPVLRIENGENPSGNAACGGVADKTPPAGESAATTTRAQTLLGPSTNGTPSGPVDFEIPEGWEPYRSTSTYEDEPAEECDDGLADLGPEQPGPDLSVDAQLAQACACERPLCDSDSGTCSKCGRAER